MNKQLPVIQPSQRLVDPEWKCQNSGECCSPSVLTMTQEERITMLLAAPVEIAGRLKFTDDPDDARFVQLEAKPCPLFVFGGCLIYSKRPYNCRRFACMRPDPKTEPLDLSGPMGCNNLSDRIQYSRVARRIYQTIQRKAFRWARAHGWKED